MSAVRTVAAAPRLTWWSTSARTVAGAQERHVARQQEHRAGFSLQKRLGLQQRVPGSELRLLQGKLNAARVPRNAPATVRSDDQ